MNHQAVRLRLCRRIDDSLRPYCELSSGSLTPEIVKDLLISLSQVYRQIKQWTLDFNCDSDDESDRDLSAGSGSHDDHQCMAKVVGILMSLLSLEKPVIQHLVGNTLVAIAEFAAVSETGWDEYMDLLCHWLKFVIHSTLSSSEEHVLSEAKESYLDASISLLPLKMRLENRNNLAVASVIRVLRNILKLLKLDMNDKHLESYLDSITDAISNAPWDSLSEAYVVSSGETLAGSAGDALRHKSAVQFKSITIFYGNLVQLFCSLVDLSCLTKVGAGSNTHPVVFEIRNLIPKILSGCFGKCGNWDDVRISHYLRHKILMLLVRLSFIVHLEHSELVSWLHLIEKYFQDLLSQPLKVQESNPDDCLEGSPFWTDDFDAKTRRISSSHLQRLAVFLFVKCSFSLVSLKEEPDEQFTVSNSVSCLTFDLHFNSQCSSRSEGLLGLQKWLQRHLPSDIFVDHEIYSQKCTSFAVSFLKLYMHEDDILFEMLLQLFHLPFNSKKRNDRGGTSSTAKNDLFCLVSDLFNPIHFFHLFLAEILYDHQVVLDYLISKDTGAKSAEYLLRCLRMVCDSWNLFMEFPERGKAPHPLCQKRRRVLADGVDFEDGLSNASVEDDLILLPIEAECRKEHGCCSKHGRNKILSAEDAKRCLLSLKTSIDSLYQKNLFPYNPQVLLRRLSRFQELCLKQVQVHTAFSSLG